MIDYIHFWRKKNRSMNTSLDLEITALLHMHQLKSLKISGSLVTKSLHYSGVLVYLKNHSTLQNHKILLSKLKYYGIREKAYDWFSSFIHNRQQFISIDEQNSELNKISHGVSQGTILGPLLFTIFINNLHYAATHSNVRHFADDTNLLFANKSIKIINKYINH